MSVRREFVFVAVLVFVMSGVWGEAQARRVTPPRSGQVGLGLQGQFGSLLDTGSLGQDFTSGPGLTVRFRYRMRYERAIGLSFENQTFDVRRPESSDTSATKMKVITSGVELFQLFGTKTNTHKMLSIGFGLAKVSQDVRNGDVLFPGDGLYVSAGAGVENFFWNSLAWDLSTRYMTVFQDGKGNHDFQVSLGFIFYVSS